MNHLAALLEEEDALTFDRFLHRLYPIPRDTVSLEDFQRRRHEDLPEMPDETLELEAFRCQIRRCLEPDAANRAWLKERMTRADAEVQARRRSNRPARVPIVDFGPNRPAQPNPASPAPAPKPLAVTFTPKEVSR